MLIISLTTLIVYSMKKVQKTYWWSSRIAFQEKKRDWILKIFTFNDKNPLNRCIISTLQFFGGSKWTRSNPISHKTIWHIPNIKNSQSKLKKMPVFFQSPLYFSFSFLDNTSHTHINSEINPPPPIISFVCKYLRQFLGTSFRVVTLPICCNIE